MEDQTKDCATCKCFCHSMKGIFIALIGLAFLLKHFGVLGDNIVNIAWPVLIILFGLKKAFGQGRCPCCKNG